MDEGFEAAKVVELGRGRGALLDRGATVGSALAAVSSEVRGEEDRLGHYLFWAIVVAEQRRYRQPARRHGSTRSTHEGTMSSDVIGHAVCSR